MPGKSKSPGPSFIERRGQSAGEKAKRKQTGRLIQSFPKSSRSPKTIEVFAGLVTVMQSVARYSRTYGELGAGAFSNERSIRSLEKTIEKLKNTKKRAQKLSILKKRLGDRFLEMGFAEMAYDKGTINEMISYLEKILKEARELKER